jgi:hypothetical protein
MTDIQFIKTKINNFKCVYFKRQSIFRGQHPFIFFATHTSLFVLIQHGNKTLNPSAVNE